MDVDLREVYDDIDDEIYNPYEYLGGDDDVGYHRVCGHDDGQEEFETESIYDMYKYCLTFSVYGTAEYLLPLILSSILFNIISSIIITRKLSHNVYHIFSIVIGIFIIHRYVPESLDLLGLYVLLSYGSFYITIKCKRLIEILLFNLIIVLYCEFSMNPKDWHKIRGVIMLAVMKTISISVDKMDDNNFPNIFAYSGYIFSSTNCIFGPWIPFNDYINSLEYKKSKSNYELIKIILSNILNGIKNIIIALIFLGISNCILSWLLPDYHSRWILAYRDALAFRTSHYFISFTSFSLLLLGGFTSSLSAVTKPLDIELPRSLVQVVVSWNIPMHNWLKQYVFRITLRKFGKFISIILTYLTSSLLHGMNFQLSAVLLSLGFYTYVEYELRNILANTFDACIAAKKCKHNKCHHKYNNKNSIFIVIINIGFLILSVFHLAYLGLVFDTSNIQNTGYDYSHTINKWSQLGFSSHWMALVTYLIYFLIK